MVRYRLRITDSRCRESSKSLSLPVFNLVMIRSIEAVRDHCEAANDQYPLLAV